MRRPGLVILLMLGLSLWPDLGLALPKSQATFARDMRGDVMYNVADTGMIMGLGRRKRSDYLSDELNKRHSAFLEDTGILMGFGKRSPEKRHYQNSFLGDTGFSMDPRKRSHLKGVDLIPVSGDKRLASNNRISSASALAKRIKVSKDSDDGIRDTDYLVYNWQ